MALLPAPIAPGAAPSVAWDWHHAGTPDLTDPAARAALPTNLRVVLSDVRHPFAVSTKDCLDWAEVPGTTAADPLVGISLSQGDFDLLCVWGGLTTDWLDAEKNVLLQSVCPAFGVDIFSAWTLVGGLDVHARRRTLVELLGAITAAKQNCGDDNRLQLEAAAFFPDEARPAGGAGSSLARNWMYEMKGAMVRAANGDTKPLALMKLAVQPKMKSNGRDLASDPYCRFLSSLKTMAAAKSEFIEQALQDVATPADEVAEYVADQWRQLVLSGFPFTLRGNMAQKNMELSEANAWMSGTAAQKEAVFKSMFGALLPQTVLVSRCVQDADSTMDLQALLGNFEQLAGIVLPGVGWSSLHCLKAIEHELRKMKLECLIDSWGDSPLEILSNLRAHFKQEKAVSSLQLKSTGSEEDKGGCLTASGLMAARSPQFLVTKGRMASCSNFLEGLDTMLESSSKLWYMKGVRQLGATKQLTGGDEMESASKHLVEWSKYWPMVVSRDRSGAVHPEVQGEEFSEDSVDSLLAGEWHEVPWIELLHQMEGWTDDVFPDPSDSLERHTTLSSVADLIFKTMKMLRLARAGESEDDVCTCTGFLAHVMKLERRSRAMPAGSAARKKALANMVDVLLGGLKEFGARWFKQWVKPVNYGEDLLTTFADKSCFVMRKVDRLGKVADTLHDLREVLPVLSGDIWEEHQNSGKPTQRPNPRVVEPPGQRE